MDVTNRKSKPVADCVGGPAGQATSSGATPGEIGSRYVVTIRGRQMGLANARTLRTTATSRRVINSHSVIWPCQSVY